MFAVKFAPDFPTIIEGLGAPFDGPFRGGKDLTGERFTAKTDFALDWYTERPLLFQHGLDKATGIAVVGRVKSWEIKGDSGLWVQAQLDANGEYFDSIKELVGQGKLYFSSGAMSHLVDVDRKSGDIKRWPWVELSLTPTPCNFYAEAHEVKSHFKAIGVDLDEAHDGLKAVWSSAMQDRLPDSAFLYVEPGTTDKDGKTTPRSKRHFPVRGADGALDEAHVRNALARIPQSTLPEAVKERALGKARKYAKSLGIDLGDDDGGTKAAGDLGPTGACVSCLADNEAACLCAACLDGRPADCLCDLGTYVLDGDSEPKPVVPAPATALSLDGCYEDVIQDVRDALNQSGPMATYGYTELLGTFADHVLACRHEWDDDGPGDQSYWRIPYTLSPTGDPVLDLSRAARLEQVYLPVEAKSAPASLTLDAHSLGQHATALLERTKDLQQRRVKEGRVFSAANVRILGQTAQTLDGAATALRDLLDATTQASEEAAKASYLASPEARARLLTLLEL